MPEQRPSPRELGLYFALAQVGVEMVVPIAVGIWLNVGLEWAPWAALVGAALGLAGGLTHLVLLLKSAEKEDRPSDGMP